jgi:hypothetical protein
VLLGNVLERAAIAPTPGAGSAEDALAPLANWRDGKSQAAGLFAHDVDGTYLANLDLNVLKYTSQALDAPFGWRDLLFTFTRTPGLPSNPVTFGAGVFGIKRASFQEWTVFAGETWKITATDVNAAITTGNAYVKLQEVTTGRWFTGSAWQNAEASILSLAAGANSALNVTVTPDTALVGRGLYRLIVTLSGVWDFTRTVQVTGPAAFPQIDGVAVIGNNIPAGATVELALASGPTWALTPRRPSFYAVDQTAGLGRVWTLTITHPTGAEVVGAPPGIGELFLGLSRTCVTFPGFPFDVPARDPAQIRLDNGTGGTEALSAAQRPLRNGTMRFRSLEAGYT